MIRSRAMILAGVSIGCFVLLFSYAALQLMLIDRVLRYNVGENMLWAVTQANREAQRLMLAVGRGEGPEEVRLRYDILYSRVALIADGPQRSYFALLGLGKLTDRVQVLTEAIGGRMQAPDFSAATVEAPLGELDEVLRRMANETVTSERDLRGQQHDQQRAAMNILLLAVFGCFASGAAMAGLLLRNVQQSALARRELERHRALLEETVAQRTQELQQALAAERRAKEVYRSFIVTVPHQFRTPLSVIHMVAQRQLRGPTERDPERLAQKFSRILDSAQRLERLLAGIMAAVNLDAQEPDRQRIDLNAVMRAALAQIGEAHPERAFRADLAPVSLWIEGDAALLEQVALNLLENAVKYSPAETVVRLTTARRGGVVSFSVSDSGIGIPAAAHATIFERFYRAPNAHHLPGMGVGLSLSRDIVTLHDGTIGFTSQEGEGATFTVALQGRGGEDEG